MGKLRQRSLDTSLQSHHNKQSAKVEPEIDKAPALVFFLPSHLCSLHIHLVKGLHAQLASPECSASYTKNKNSTEDKNGGSLPRKEELFLFDTNAEICRQEATLPLEKALRTHVPISLARLCRCLRWFWVARMIINSAFSLDEGSVLYFQQAIPLGCFGFIYNLLLHCPARGWHILAAAMRCRSLQYHHPSRKRAENFQPEHADLQLGHSVPNGVVCWIGHARMLCTETAHRGLEISLARGEYGMDTTENSLTSVRC